MKFYSIYIILFFSISFLVVSQAQEVRGNDTIRIEMPELPVNLDLQQFEIGRRAGISPFLYTPPSLVPYTEHHLRNFSVFGGTVPIPTNINIIGFGQNSLTNINRTVLFSTEATPNLMFYSAATLGVLRTLQYGNINYYNVDMGAAFTLNHLLSGSVGIFYRSALEFPIPITGTYLNIHYQIANGLHLFGSGTFQNVQLHRFGVSQQSLMLEGRLRQDLTNRWSVSVYGGTPVFENSGRAGMPMNPLLSTYYGASLEYWFSETVAVEGGVVWQRSPFTGQMQARPRVGFQTRQFRFRR